MSAPSEYDELIRLAAEKHYFTGEPCSRGHIAKRYISNRRCVECSSRPEEKERSAKYLKEYRKTEKYKAKKPLYDKTGKANYLATEKGVKKQKEYSSRPEVKEKCRISIASRRLRPEVKEKEREYAKRKYREDPNFRLAKLLRSRAREAMKGKLRPGSAVAFLGCSIQEARAHIESKFVEGMSWGNHGEWHIDHIKPLASFDLSNEEQFSEACNFKNLQPLWRIENQRKGGRIQ